MKKLFLVAAVIFLVACSSDNDTTTPLVEIVPELPEEPEVPEPISIALEGHDNMTYVGNTAIQVSVGQEITLTLTNVGQLPKESMGHNLVVLIPGTDLADFAGAAFGAKADDYIPASFATSIVTHTNLLGPGESDTKTFQINTPGTYDFVCSFPGHWGTMKGTFTVE
ncbi:plastocyanin/azurin family copper-binding protein [Xanthomarina sp.]|uniref:plastocyanin/azurin family copper-binding protein n=1 Tax=Xanthomarina sp. TaxID=1931211 RepID=UPI002CCF1592|nr:plastocyanin/azurin family copper-binding protein [Xanthomarina sp.]HLV38890.1 plastocyanin/azurin family copper-binding protein [Xanthomarina sp.]